MNSMPLFEPPRPPLSRPPLRPLRPVGRHQSMVEQLLMLALARMTPDQRAAFEERVAICTYDGGLTETEAIRVAASAVASPERSKEHAR